MVANSEFLKLYGQGKKFNDFYDPDLHPFAITIPDDTESLGQNFRSGSVLKNFDPASNKI